MKYVFFTNTIYDIGGAELYIRYKIKFVSNLGYEPIIVYCSKKGVVYIEEFKNKSVRVDEITYPPCYYCEKRREKTVARILAYINGDSNTIIESHLPFFALWGETISELLRCKHILYFLAENYPKYDVSIYRFLEFKLRRKELAGINRHSLQLLFGNYRTLNENERYSLTAYMGCSIEDIVSPLKDLPDLSYDIRIGCIGRLEKTYVNATISSVSDYCKKNPSKRIQLILIGGTKSNTVLSFIRRTNNNFKNLKIDITGYVYPIPLCLIQALSFVVGGSDAVYAPTYYKILTVSMDIYGKPIGVFGITTRNDQHRDNTDNDSNNLHHYINDISSGRYKKDDIQLKIHYNLPEEAFSSHIDFINNSEKNRDYYDTKHVGNAKLACVYRIFGKVIYETVNSVNQKRRLLCLKVRQGFL